jgi:hypothetical protein
MLWHRDKAGQVQAVGGKRSGGGAGWRGGCAGLITHTVPNQGLEPTACSSNSCLAFGRWQDWPCLLVLRYDERGETWEKCTWH